VSSLLALQSELASAGPPSLFWVWPFLAILLSIAIFPLLHRTHEWWEHNRSKLLVSLILAAATLCYYACRGYGVEVHEEGGEPAQVAHAEDELSSAPATDEQQPGEAHAHKHYSPPGSQTVLAVLEHAVLKEYVPFMVLLFSLFVIAGGIIGIGGLLASLIGTTGASMLLIRLLLKTNAERKRVVHTVIFFIFIVSNIGGTLLPIGDPPLFLGYLRGVEFFWTLTLWKQWAFMLVILLAVYYAWDTWAFKRERPADVLFDRVHVEPIRVAGLINFLWLLGVVVAVATLDPAKPFPGTDWHAKEYMREGVQLAMVALSLLTTRKVLRVENKFNYIAIGEVACLFIGIFITMQVPIEILHAAGPKMAAANFTHPWQFFWATGVLSSFLDNAPTYVVFFETAGSLPVPESGTITLLGGGQLSVALLTAVSCGAVFMGANSYIGNGPNFMVKTIAEQSGVKMPSFFGYMVFSVLILGPLFVILTLVFFRG
jgi:Na+/H+ antiporter NhaD/arsenite permease-like protein